MAKEGLVNCKKCGTLFFKTSEREICEDCFNKELETIDKIKNFANSSSDKVTMEDIIRNVPNLDENEIEDLITRGRLFAVLPKISMKCRFCGAELENDEKSGFTCKKCISKFSPKMSEAEKNKTKQNSFEEEAKNLNRRLRGGIRGIGDSQSRYGFIQNYDL